MKRTFKSIFTPLFFLPLVYFACEDKGVEITTDEVNPKDIFSLIPSSMKFSGEIDDLYNFTVDGEIISAEVTSQENHDDYTIVIGEGESINIGGKVIFKDG